MNRKYTTFFMTSWILFLTYVVLELSSHGKYSQYSSVAGSYIFIVSVVGLLCNSKWIYSMEADHINIEGSYFGLFPTMKKQIKFEDIRNIEPINYKTRLAVFVTLARLPEVCGNIRFQWMYLIHLKSSNFFPRRILVTPNQNLAFVKSLEDLKVAIENKK